MLGLQLEAAACAGEQLRQECFLPLRPLTERKAAWQGRTAHSSRKGPVVVQDLLLMIPIGPCYRQLKY